MTRSKVKKLSVRDVKIPDSIEAFFTTESVNARTMFMSAQIDAVCMKVLESVTVQNLLDLSPIQRLRIAKDLITMRKELLVNNVISDRDVDSALEGLKKTKNKPQEEEE